MSAFTYSFMIVTAYLVVGVVLMLASGTIASLLKRLGTKPVTYARVAMFTFGACVAALGTFGVTLHVAAVLSVFGFSLNLPS